MHRIHYAVKQGCVRLRDALKCTTEALFTVMKSRIADWKATMAFVADCWGEAESRRPATSASTTHVELRLEVVLVVIPISAE